MVKNEKKKHYHDFAVAAAPKADQLKRASLLLNNGRRLSWPHFFVIAKAQKKANNIILV